MAGSKQCQLLREGIPGSCLQRVCRTQEGTGVLGHRSLAVTAQHALTTRKGSLISWHKLLHNLPVLLPPLPPVPYPTGGEIPILFLPAASTNNLAGKLFFFLRTSAML